MTKTLWKIFWDIDCLKRLIKVQNPEKNKLILTNQSNLFQHSNAFEIGFSDFHLLAVTEFKMGFQKLITKSFAYCDYKNVAYAIFRSDVFTVTSDVDNFGMYKSIIFNILNPHVPIKK